MFKPLTEEQYNSAIQAGFSHDDIIANEIQRKKQDAEQPPGYLSRLGQEVFGNKPATGIVSGLLKSTIGSEGAAGLIARPVSSIIAGVAAKPLVESQNQLMNVTKAISDKIQSLPVNDPARIHLMDVLKGNQNALGIGTEQLKSLEANVETPSQVAGTALNTAATALSVVNPATFASKMLLSTGIGSLYGAGKKLNENASPEDILKGAAVGGITGAVTQGTMSGIGAAAKWATQKLPSFLLEKKLGFTPKDIQQGAHEKAVNFILNNKKVGSISGLANESEAVINNLDTKVDDFLATNSRAKGAVVSNQSIADATASRLQKQGWSVKGEDIINAVKDFIGKGRGSNYLIKDANNVIGANTLRKGIDAATKPSAFVAAKNPISVTMAMEFADTLRSAVQKIAPETEALFNEMSKNISLRNALNVAESKGQKIGGMYDILSAIMGGAGGLFTGSLGAGAGAGFALQRGATSMPAVSAASVGLNQLGKLTPYLSKLTPALRLFLLNTLSHGTSGIVGNEKNQ